MRYLITSYRSAAQVILGYDAQGLLIEVQVKDMPEDEATRTWPFRHAPLREADVAKVFRSANLKTTVLNVTFEEFWVKYNYKEGKKDAEKAWARLSEADRQLAYAYIDSYKGACQRDGKHMQYPATYLRAMRWLDKL